MQNLPHRYAVTATADKEGTVDLTSPGLPRLESAPPAEFGGPGDQWSPETLLCAVVADCFILTFKAIARASKMDWISLACDVDGILDRIDSATQFTEFSLHAVLEVPQSTDKSKATRILEKSEHACLITNSLKSETRLNTVVQFPE